MTPWLGMSIQKGRTILQLVWVSGLLLLSLGFITACGTLDISLEEADTILESTAMPTSTGAINPITSRGASESVPVVAWYGTIHSVPGSATGDDYLKPWHLEIWPKFGPAVGLTGIDPAVNAEIDRLRDQDIKATFWGDLTCNVADYGACQLLVERISPNDGGPQYGPDRVEGWRGSVGLLPVQPGSQNDLLYFVLEGQVNVLYGIASTDPAIQFDLERLAEEGASIRVWGSLGNKAQLVTGTVIDVDRLEIVSP